jgi:hypothetical protein
MSTPVVCPTCGETVREWIETAEAVHCYRTGRGWTKHRKEKVG